MTRVYNFSAGPAALPEDVLQQAQAEMLDWQGSGMSVMEMSHRGKEFMSIATEAEADLLVHFTFPAGHRTRIRSTTYDVADVPAGALPAGRRTREEES